MKGKCTRGEDCLFRHEGGEDKVDKSWAPKKWQHVEQHQQEGGQDMWYNKEGAGYDEGYKHYKKKESYKDIPAMAYYGMYSGSDSASAAWSRSQKQRY